MSMDSKKALRGFEKGKNMDLKVPGLPERVIAKKKKNLKITMCDIEFSAITRRLCHEEIYRTSNIAFQKGK